MTINIEIMNIEKELLKKKKRVLYKECHENINTDNCNPEKFLSEHATQRLKEILGFDFK